MVNDVAETTMDAWYGFNVSVIRSVLGGILSTTRTRSVLVRAMASSSMSVTSSCNVVVLGTCDNAIFMLRSKTNWPFTIMRYFFPHSESKVGQGTFSLCSAFKFNIF